MTSKEAKDISIKASKEKTDMTELFNSIKRKAEEGEFSTYFQNVSEAEEYLFRENGYTVSKHPNGTTEVKWK